MKVLNRHKLMALHYVSAVKESNGHKQKSETGLRAERS